MDTNHNVTLNVTVDGETSKNIRETVIVVVAATTLGYVVKQLTMQGLRLATDLVWRKTVKG